MATKQDGMSMTDSMADDIVIIPEDQGMTSSFGEKDQFESPEKSITSELDAHVQCNPVINKQKLEIELLGKSSAGEKRDGENCNSSWDYQILTDNDVKSQHGFIYPLSISLTSFREYTV